MNSKSNTVKKGRKTHNSSTIRYSDLDTEKSNKKTVKQLSDFLKSKLKLPRFKNKNTNRDVLVVARNFQTRYLFEIILRKQGFSVTTISNVDEILDIINGNYIAILFDETNYNTEDLDIVELIKISNPEVKLLTISMNLRSNRLSDVSTSHKMSSNYKIRVVNGSSSKVSKSVTVKEIIINESV